jgi:hypothetical protein
MLRACLMTCVLLAVMIQAIGQSKSDNNYFPIAVWLQSPSNAVAYKANGINMYIGLWRGLDQKQLTELQSARLSSSAGRTHSD